LRQEMRPIAFSDSFQVLRKVKNDWGIIQRPKLTEYCSWLGIPRRDSGAFASQKERAKWRPRPFAKKKRISLS
jgi:hypothetical protein